MSLSIADLESLIDDLRASKTHRQNRMFQLSLVVARRALSAAVSESYKEAAAQYLLELVRAKRQSGTAIPLTVFTTISEPAREQRKPWLIDAQTCALPQMPSAMPVSMTFGSSGLV